MGERQGVTKRLGVTLYRLAEVHRRRGLGVPVGSARVAAGGGMEGSGVFVGVVEGARERKEERGELHAGHRSGASIGRAGRRSGASCRRERRAREQAGGLLARSGRRGASTGTRGRLEVAGRRGVNGRVPCQALQSATLAGIRGFPASARAHLCLEAAGGVGKILGEPWML